MATAARHLACRLLIGAERGRTLSDRLAEPAVEALPARERAFLHELVLGTLRHRGAIDYALAPLLDRPLGRLDAPLLAILRLGAHQVLHLRVPDRAAVSEAVELARELAPRAAGYCNAVLRRLAREGPPAPPDPQRDPRGWLTTAGSLPPWLAERWLARLGVETAVARARAALAVPPETFRLNPRRPEAAQRAHELAPRPLAVPGAWQATAGRPVELAAEGLLYLQDEGSQLIAHLAAAEGDVLDACAAPGGKSALLDDLGGGRTRVFAQEVSTRRLRATTALLRRWGAQHVYAFAGDAGRPALAAVRQFDAVLLDAPCSGLGTLGRHPDLRWRVREDDIGRQAVRQARLLEALAPHVRAGGRLVYAVCSLEREENEGVIEPFLSRHADFAAAPLPRWAEPFASGPFACTRPERSGGDGFFAAVLVRAGGAGQSVRDRLPGHLPEGGSGQP